MKETETNGKVSASVLVKSSFWYVLSGFLTRAIGFLTVPIYTRILTKGQLGDFTVYSSWQAILVIVCGLEIYGTINRARFDYPNEKDFHGYITSCLALSTMITAVFFAAYLLVPDLFYRLLLVDHKYMILMFLYLFAYPAYAMFQAKQRIEYKYKLNAAVAFTVVIGSSVASLILTNVMTSDRLWGRIFGQYTLYVLAGAVFYFYFLRKSTRVRLSDCGYALRVGIPLVLSLLGSNILLSSDNLVVKHICGEEAVSYLSIAHTSTTIILVLVQMLNSAWAPWFFDKLKVESYRVIRKTFAIYVWVVIAGTLAVLLLGPELVLVLGDKAYAESIWILPASMVNGVCTVLTAQLVNLEIFHKKSHYAAIITGSVAVLNVLLDVVAVQLWGYRAACYVTVACQILLIGLHFYCTRTMRVAELLPLKQLLLYVAVIVLMIPLSLVLYTNNLLRWVFIALVVVAAGTAVIWKRRLILDFVAQFRKKRA